MVAEDAPFLRHDDDLFRRQEDGATIQHQLVAIAGALGVRGQV